MALPLTRLARLLAWAMVALLALMAADIALDVAVPHALAGVWGFRLEVVESLAAAVCALHARQVRRERVVWALISAAIVATVGGDIYTDTVLAHLAHVPYPSLADAMYILFYPTVFVALALLVRARGGVFPINVWLDGATSASGVAMVVGAFVFPVLLHSTGGDTMTVITNVAYPICDTVLLGLVICVIVTMGWRAGRAWVLLALGMLAWSVGDLCFLYQTAVGSYHRGSYVDLTYPTALALVVLASRQPARTVASPAAARWSLLVVPAFFGTVALAIDVYDHFHRVETVALLLSALTLAFVLLRLGLTFGEYTRALADSRHEAVSDPLTGLGNRRALARDLEQTMRRGAPRTVLALFDLDGFKAYNDTFGHPAGDTLLQRLALRLVAADHGGRVYRLGGDEFCVLAPLGDGDAQEVGRHAARALSERGDLYEITSSYGLVVLPDETDGMTDAMRVADQRLYLHKGVGRRSQTGETVDTLARIIEARERDLADHGLSVAELAEGLAAAYHLPEAECEQIRHAAVLHDLGKLAIAEQILHKSGPLDHAERELMRTHPALGQWMLGESPALAPIGAMVRSSHERWDGAGYPDGLSRTAIPIGGRIVAICDAYDAMVTTRSYRPGISHEAAIAELRRCAGKQFDPGMVAPFIRLVERRRQRLREAIAA
jgi:two-component system cell cycle response regulator